MLILKSFSPVSGHWLNGNIKILWCVWIINLKPFHCHSASPVFTVLAGVEGRSVLRHELTETRMTCDPLHLLFVQTADLRSDLNNPVKLINMHSNFVSQMPRQTSWIQTVRRQIFCVLLTVYWGTDILPEEENATGIVSARGTCTGMPDLKADLIWNQLLYSCEPVREGPLLTKQYNRATEDWRQMVTLYFNQWKKQHAAIRSEVHISAVSTKSNQKNKSCLCHW